MNEIINNSQFQEILDNILNNINLEQNIKNLINLIVKLLNDKFKDSGHHLDFSSKFKSEIVKNIKIIILQFIAVSKEKLAQIIIDQFIEEFNKNKTKKSELIYQLSEKDKKRIEEERRKIAIYEEYKAINPRQIAGETEIDNSISNSIITGLKAESKHYKENKQNLKNSSEILDKVYKQNKNRNGWTR